MLFFVVVDVFVVAVDFFDYCHCLCQGGSLHFVMHTNQGWHVLVKCFALTDFSLFDTLALVFTRCQAEQGTHCWRSGHWNKYLSYRVTPGALEACTVGREELSAGVLS